MVSTFTVRNAETAYLFGEQVMPVPVEENQQPAWVLPSNSIRIQVDGAEQWVIQPVGVIGPDYQFPKVEASFGEQVMPVPVEENQQPAWVPPSNAIRIQVDGAEQRAIQPVGVIGPDYQFPKVEASFGEQVMPVPVEENQQPAWVPPSNAIRIQVDGAEQWVIQPFEVIGPDYQFPKVEASFGEQVMPVPVDGNLPLDTTGMSTVVDHYSYDLCGDTAVQLLIQQQAQVQVVL